MKPSHALACLLTLLTPAALRADNARFDLQGPKIDVKVTRGDKTLPIAQVPNLQPGDKLWVKADLPDDQRNHLLLIVAFLRGTTNEPPDNWFTEIDTWDKKHTAEGTTVTVPADAQQALLFVAPETGGDFKTLRSAVKGRPGLFIRADADLNQASFEQQRIEHYLEAMKTVPQDDPNAIKDHSAKLAATLNLKPNADCFKQPVDQQINCLTQSSAPVLLDDGHGQTIAESLSTGASSDFINAASATQAAGGGVYSAYVGAVVDLVHLVSTLRTAKYQYIPCLSFPQNSTLNLKLNAPVSFINPKSVIVIGLPAIQKAVPPPLRPQHPDQVACLLQPKMPLLLEGAPLVFATNFAHDLVLHVNRAGNPQDIPLTPDAFEGGLVVTDPDKRQPLKDEKSDPKPGAPSSPTASSSARTGSAVGPAPNASSRPEAAGRSGETPVSNGARAEGTSQSASHEDTQTTDLTVTGTVRGFWGFDPFDGPTLTLQQTDGKNWKIVGDTQLLAGQDNKLTLKGDGTACVQKIELTTAKDKDVDVTFKPAGTDQKDSPATKDTLALDVSLKKVQPGGYALAIQQYGDPKQDKVPLTAYTSDIHLEAVKIHEGDNTAVLTGQGLTNVAQVEIANQTFTAAGDENDDNTLNLSAKTAVTPKDDSEASVKLKDGRTMTVKIDTQAPRPGLQLVSFTATPAQQNGSVPVTLLGKDEIPLNGKLTFVVQTKDAFPRNQKIEVATEDNAVHTALSLADNTLILQDPHTAIATLDPLKAFGQSAFGKLQMRPVAADGTPGNWTPLGTLVRTPQITAINCTASTSIQPAPTATQPQPGATGSLATNSSSRPEAEGRSGDSGSPAGLPVGVKETPVLNGASAAGTSQSSQNNNSPQPQTTCTLNGTNLFLVQSFAPDKTFTNPADVPSGYAQTTLPVPTPADGTTLYLKLRDDPNALATVTLPNPIQKPNAPTASAQSTPSQAAPASGPNQPASSQTTAQTSPQAITPTNPPPTAPPQPAAAPSQPQRPTSTQPQ